MLEKISEKIIENITERLKSKSLDLLNYKDTDVHPRAVVFVDYENIFRRIEDYGSNIIELDLVGNTIEYFSNKGFSIIDFQLYANFDVDHFHTSFHQTYLQSLGVTTKHTSYKGKNSSDIQLVVDALKLVYKNPLIDAFIILSSDRDMIPLIQAIRQEGKMVFLITTKTNFANGMIYFTDYHEYLENILDINPDSNVVEQTLEIGNISDKDIEHAYDIMIILTSSKIWQNYIKGGVPINYEEYKKLVVKLKMMLPIEVDRLFRIAEKMEWIQFYSFMRKNNEIIGIKAGDKIDEFLESDIYKKHLRGND